MDFNQCCEGFISKIKSFPNPEKISLKDVNELIERLENFKKCKKPITEYQKLTSCFNNLFTILYKYSSARIHDENYVPVIRNILQVVLSVLDEHGLFNTLFPYFVMIINRFVTFKHPPMKEILKVYNLMISKVSLRVIAQNEQEYVHKLYELATDSSNIELQAISVEIQLKLFCIDVEINQNMLDLFNTLDVKNEQSVLNNYPLIRMALDSLNSHSEIIFSQNCSRISINSQRIVEFEGSDEEDGIYLDIDVKSCKMSFFCEKSTLKSLFNVNFATSWEVISFFTKNVQSVTWKNIPELGIQILLQIKRNNLIILSDTQDESILNLEILCEMNSERFTEFTMIVLPQIFSNFNLQNDSEQLIVNELPSSPIISTVNCSKTYEASTQKKPIKISRKSNINAEKERFTRLKPGAKSRASSRSSLSFSESIIGKARKEEIHSKVSAKIKQHNLPQTMTPSQELKVKKGSYSELLVNSENSMVENWLKVCPAGIDLEDDLETIRCENLPEDHASENKIILDDIDKHNLTDKSNISLNSSSTDICKIILPADKTVIELPVDENPDFDALSHVSDSTSESEDENAHKCRYATRSRTQQNKQTTRKRALSAIKRPKRPRISLSTISERTEKTTARKTYELEEIVASLAENVDTAFVKHKSVSNNSNSTSSKLDKSNTSLKKEQDLDNTVIVENTVIADKTVEVTVETLPRNNSTRLTEISMEIEEQSEIKAPPCIYPNVTVLNEDNFDEISHRNTSSPIKRRQKPAKRSLSQSSFDKIESFNTEMAKKPPKRKEPQPSLDKIPSLATNNASISSIDTKTEKSTTISVINKTHAQRTLFDHATYVSDLTRTPEKRIDLTTTQQSAGKQKKRAPAKPRKSTSKKSSPKRKKRTAKRLNTSFSLTLRKPPKISYDNLFDSMIEEHKVYNQKRAEYHQRKGIEKSELSPADFEEFEKCLEVENESSPFKPNKIQIISNIVLQRGEKVQESCENCKEFSLTLNSLLQQFHATHSK